MEYFLFFTTHTLTNQHLTFYIPHVWLLLLISIMIFINNIFQHGQVLILWTPVLSVLDCILMLNEDSPNMTEGFLEDQGPTE